MCKLLYRINLILCLCTISLVSCFNRINSDRNPTSKAVIFEDDFVKLPTSIKIDPNSELTLPTNEDLYSNYIADNEKKELESQKQTQEIIESVENGLLIDPKTKEKLFQQENDEEEKVEEKEVSLDSSGEYYNEGVNSSAEELNDISNNLQPSSDGVNGQDDIQLRENLLDKLMASQAVYNIGA